jgi:hypothetical protein
VKKFGGYDDPHVIGVPEYESSRKNLVHPDYQDYQHYPDYSNYATSHKTSDNHYHE